MWFLGAGASASAGIPTALDMVWEFKQLLFVSQRRASLQSVSDLSSPVVRSEIQGHIDSAASFPVQGSPEEYGALFEAAFPSEQDRRSYLEAKVRVGKPSYGHLALATLMKAGLTRIVWTTNFDSLIADACAKVYEATGNLTTASLDAPHLTQAIVEERWPVEVKLHGDFRSRRLKNVAVELCQQDERLRDELMQCCRRFGLVVAGYSGRDHSIMDALYDVAKRPGSFPAGLFWLHRGPEEPLPRVIELLGDAITRGAEAALVRVENFDETLRDLVRLHQGLDTSTLEQFAGPRRRWSPAPLPVGRRAWPVIRLNALEIVQSPTVCRRVTCSVGGVVAARRAAELAGVNIIVTRRRSGVLAFGADADVRRAFGPYDLSGFDLYTLDLSKLRHDSTERGLIREALSRALVRECQLRLAHAGRQHELVPADPAGPLWQPLQNIVGRIAGNVTGHPELAWSEGLRVRLDWADDRLWVLFDPGIVFEGVNPANKSAAADFARERTVKRYNSKLNDLLDFWGETIAQGGRELRAFGIGDGVDATFRLATTTAYSKRAAP